MTLNFGELRSLIHQPTKDETWRNVLWALLNDAYEEDPAHYNDQWRPYLSSVPATTWSTPLQRLRALNELTLAATIAPFARFEMTMRHTPMQQLLDHPNTDLLTGLYIWNSAIQPNDLISLGLICPELESLSLDEPEHDTPLFEALVENEPWMHLKRLELRDIKLDNDNIHTLVNSPNFPELEVLILSGNHLDDQALTYIANAQSLPKLQHIELENNEIYGSGLVDLAKSPLLKQLRRISITSSDDNYMASNHDVKIDYRDYVDFLRATQTLPNPIEIHIDVEEPDWAGEFYRSAMHQDQAVDFGGYFMDDDDFLFLCQHPKLKKTKKLHFTDMQLEASNLQILFESDAINHIEELDITQATLPPNTSNALARLQHLQSLHLYETNLNDAMWLDTLKQANWPKLTELGLGYSQLTDVSIRAIAEKVPHLEDITLWNNNFTFGGLLYFLQHTPSHHLDQLSCDGMALPHQPTAYVARTHKLHINRFDMEDCELGEPQLELLLENLQDISISRLDLGHNHIGPSGAKSLAQCHHLHKTNIILSHNPIENEGFLAIARSEHMRGITEMNIGGMELTQEVFFELQDHTMPWVKFWCNLPTMDIHGFEAMLKVCTNVRDFIFSQGPNADQALAALSKHPLHQLCLFTKSLTDEGVNTLLKHPWLEQLRTLRFWRTPITNISAQRIANCQRLRQLEHLSFSETAMDDEGLNSLRQSPFLSDGIKGSLR